MCKKPVLREMLSSYNLMQMMNAPMSFEEIAKTYNTTKQNVFRLFQSYKYSKEIPNDFLKKPIGYLTKNQKTIYIYSSGTSHRKILAGYNNSKVSWYNIYSNTKGAYFNCADYKDEKQLKVRYYINDFEFYDLMIWKQFVDSIRKEDTNVNI